MTESVEVGANNLTLDGNGHTLDGQGNCSEGSGIHFNARTTLVIKNFTIKNFCDGMNFTNSISNSILDNTITNNSHEGIFIQNSNDNLISNNVFTNNGYEGLEISYSVDDVISNNVFTDNGEDNAFWALRIHYSDGFTITGNTVSSTSTAQLSGGEQSHDYGIYVEDGGGGFHNPDDFTLVGIIKDDVEYYVPDTLTILTLEELQARQLAIHAKYPMKDDTSKETLSDEEVNQVVADWVNERE